MVAKHIIAKAFVKKYVTPLYEILLGNERTTLNGYVTIIVYIQLQSTLANKECVLHNDHR